MPPSEAENSERSSNPPKVIRNDDSPGITADRVAGDGDGSRVLEPAPGPSGDEEDSAIDRGEIEAAPGIRTYPPEDAIVRRMEPGVRFVDVREAHEVAGGIVPGAVHIPLDRVEAAIDPDSPHYNAAFEDASEVVFYCRSGRRSAVAAQRATEMGIDHVAHAEGGIRAWAAAGGQVRTVGTPDRS